MNTANENTTLAQEKPQLREPELKTINVSGKRDPKSYKLVAKLILRKFGKLELRSLNNASSSVVKLAESLVRNGFAEYENISSDIVELQDKEQEDQKHSGISFIIVLKKSSKFAELFTEFN